MPSHILGGSVPTLDLAKGTQNPNDSKEKYVYLIHGYDSKETYYGLSNYCRRDHVDKNTGQTASGEIYSFNEGVGGNDYKNITNAEVFLQAQKIQDATVRAAFIKQYADNPNGAQKAFDQEKKDLSGNVIKMAGAYAQYAPIKSGSTAQYSLSEWSTRAEQVQNYINYVKYQENPSFKAAIDAYKDAKEKWEAGGKVGPRPWIGEDTGAANYRDDSWGMGHEMLGANKLGNSQVAFADALMDQTLKPDSDNPKLTLKDFSAGVVFAAMANKNEQATQAYRVHVQPVLMAAAGWQPKQIAEITANVTNNKRTIADIVTTPLYTISSSYPSPQGATHFLSDRNAKTEDVRGALYGKVGTSIANRVNIQASNNSSMLLPGKLWGEAASQYPTTSARAAAPTHTHTPAHTAPALAAASAPKPVAKPSAPAAAPAAVTVPVATNSTATNTIATFLAAADETVKAVKKTWKLKDISQKNEDGKSTYNMTFADDEKVTAVISAESAKIKIDGDAVKYMCTVNSGALSPQQQYELIAHQSFAAACQKNADRPDWMRAKSVTIAAIAVVDANSPKRVYRKGGAANEDSGVSFTETEYTVLTAYKTAGYTSATYQGHTFDLKNFVNPFAVSANVSVIEAEANDLSSRTTPGAK